MFFVFSKLFGFAIDPVNFLGLLFIVGSALCLLRPRPAGRAAIALAATLYVVCCFSPLGAILVRVLEDRFPPFPSDALSPTGIIVLGGSIEEELSLARGAITLNHAAARLTAGVALARQFPAARLIFTGGPSDVLQNDHDEADGVRRLWLSLGMPSARMTFESRSRNTFENAVLTKQTLLPKPGERWLLVTSAWHMPRSVGVFRQAGFDVIPYPVDYRTFGDNRDYMPSGDGLNSLELLQIAVHEWLGLLVYRATDKVSVLFPQPDRTDLGHNR